MSIRAIKAEVPYDISSVDADSDADLANFHYSQGVTFSATILREGREERKTFDAFKTDMRSNALNSMLVHETRLRRKHSVDWTAIELPVGCVQVSADEGEDKLVIKDK
jgi:hypothetical protein